MFYSSIRLSIYAGVAFLSFLATIAPVTGIGVFFILLGYAGYIVYDTFLIFNSIEAEGQFRNREAIQRAIGKNWLDISLFVITILVGLYLGVYPR